MSRQLIASLLLLILPAATAPRAVAQYAIPISTGANRGVGSLPIIHETGCANYVAGSGTTTTCTVTGLVGGEFVLVQTLPQANTTVTVADSGGATAIPISYASSQASWDFGNYYFNNVASGSHTFTVTYNSSQAYHNISVDVFQNVSTTYPIADFNPPVLLASCTTTPASLTSTLNNQMAVSAYFAQNVAPTVPSGWTGLNTSTIVNTADLALPTSGTVASAAWGASGGGLCISAMVLLNNSSVSAPTSPVSGSSLWLSADCITYTSSVCGTPSNGTSISAWADHSGNGNSWSKTTGTCTFNTGQINGKPAVNFSGCYGNLATQVGTGTVCQATMFLVYRTSSSGSIRAFGAPFGGLSWFVYGTAGTQGIDNQDNVNISYATNFIAANTYTQINYAWSSAGTNNFRMASAADTAAHTSSTCAVSGGPNTIGSDGSSLGSGVFSGDWVEFVYYANVTLTPAQVKQNEAYFRAKYGIS